MSVKLITTDTINLTGGTEGQVLSKGTGTTLNWIDAGGGGGYTFGNGVTDFGEGNVGLGGTLSSDVTIDAPNHGIFLGDNSTSKAKLSIVPYAQTLIAEVDDNTYRGALYLNPNNVNFGLNKDDASGASSLQITRSQMFITDGINSKGLTYADDYSANYTDRSLVDKAYVDSHAGGGFADQTLTSNVTIDAATNGVTFSGADGDTNWSINAKTAQGMGSPNAAIYLSANSADGSNNYLNINGGFYLSSNKESSFTTLTINDGGWYLGYQINGDDPSPQFNIDSSGLIYDTARHAGLFYADDYSPNFSGNSLVTKSYVGYNSIQNQIFSAQTAGFWIDGTGVADTIEVANLNSIHSSRGGAGDLAINAFATLQLNANNGLTINAETTIEGSLHLANEPVNDNDAATKAYVDAHAGGGGFTFVNGLTDFGEGNIGLGGNLLMATTIDVGTSYSTQLVATDVTNSSVKFTVSGDLGNGSYLDLYSSSAADFLFADVQIQANSGINLSFGSGSATTLSSMVLGVDGIIVTDSTHNKGIVYGDDYSANYTDRSLVDKSYVDAYVNYKTNVITSNGLTYAGVDNGGIKLGGTLTENTSIYTTDSDNNSYNFIVDGGNPADFGGSKFNFAKDGASIFISTPTIRTSLGIGTDYFSLTTTENTTYNTISIESSWAGNNILVSGFGSFKGFQYASDYSANYDERSLVDKAYVDNAIAAAIAALT